MSPRLGLVALLATAGCAAPPPAVDFDPAARAAIADTIRAVSNEMVTVMRTRAADSVLAFYSRNTAYVGNGEIGDWPAIVRGAPPRYATYTKVECAWVEPLRIDVLSRTSAVLTGILDCQKADTTGAAWREFTARTEVLAPEDGRWRIVAVNESIQPGTGELR